MNHNRHMALKQGNKTYISDKPCKHGHPTIRYANTGICTECSKIAQKKSLNNRKKRMTGKFYQGMACLHGHSGLRYVSTGLCVQCSKERNAKPLAAGFGPPSYKRVSVWLHPEAVPLLEATAQQLNIECEKRSPVLNLSAPGNTHDSTTREDTHDSTTRENTHDSTTHGAFEFDDEE